MSIVPRSKPQRPRTQIEELIEEHGLPTDLPVLVGIRGYYKDSMGKPGKNDQAMYDDALFVISPESFNSYNFNTDPQKAGFKHAMLVPGKYKFYKGKHKGKYNALRPYPEGVRLPCTRDGVRSMCSATNIHKGGFNDTFSEGCQTIYPTQYDAAMRDDIYKLMTKYGLATIDYLLVEE